MMCEYQDIDPVVLPLGHVTREIGFGPQYKLGLLCFNVKLLSLRSRMHVTRGMRMR